MRGTDLDCGGGDELAARGWGGRGRPGPVDLREDSQSPERGEMCYTWFCPSCPSSGRDLWGPVGRIRRQQQSPHSRTSRPASKSGTAPTWAPSPRSSSSIFPALIGRNSTGKSVIYAILVPYLAKSDSLGEDRRFLGMILESSQDTESTAFLAYSLSRRRVVVRAPLPGNGAQVKMFLANEGLIVASTTTPLPLRALAYLSDGYTLIILRICFKYF